MFVNNNVGLISFKEKDYIKLKYLILGESETSVKNQDAGVGPVWLNMPFSMIPNRPICPGILSNIDNFQLAREE